MARPVTTEVHDLDLEIRGLVVAGNVSGQRLLDSVDLQVIKGEIVGLVGASGSGKSTLIRCALGLPPSGFFSEGSVRLLGADVGSHAPSATARMARRQVAYIAQNPYAGFVPDVAIGRQITFLARSRGVLDAGLPERAERLLVDLGIKHPRELLDSPPRQLSGGQLQRMQVALAMVVRPAMIFADEVIASLDPINASRVAAAFVEHQREFGTTALIASHDLWFIQSVCHRWYRIVDGRAVRQ